MSTTTEEMNEKVFPQGLVMVEPLGVDLVLIVSFLSNTRPLPVTSLMLKNPELF